MNLILIQYKNDAQKTFISMKIIRPISVSSRAILQDFLNRHRIKEDVPDLLKKLDNQQIFSICFETRIKKVEFFRDDHQQICVRTTKIIHLPS